MSDDTVRTAAVEVCPDCGGSGVLENPQWAAWWQLQEATERAWTATHPGEVWEKSPECALLEEHCPADDVAAEEPCPSCEGDGDADHLPGLIKRLRDEFTNADPGGIAALAAHRLDRADPAPLEQLYSQLGTIGGIVFHAQQIVRAELDRADAIRHITQYGLPRTDDDPPAEVVMETP
jgi:hypothetical protein